MDLAYSLVFRLGWQAVAILAVLMMAAPNLLFMVLRSLGSRRMARIEQAIFDSASGKSATYENNAFFSQPSQNPCGSEREYGSSTHLQRAERRRMMSSPAHNFRKAAFFYQPLHLDEDSAVLHVRQHQPPFSVDASDETKALCTSGGTVHPAKFMETVAHRRRSCAGGGGGSVAGFLDESPVKMV